MYEIKLEEDAEYWDHYKYTSKNDKGQILTLKISSVLTSKNIKYYILFYIGTKRKKGFQFMEGTGKDGLKSLIWARNCIKDFISELPKSWRYKKYSKHSIIVQWDDNRRRNTYYYGLKSLGFYYGVDYLRKSLIKNI